ncbi:MAG: DUF2442 domain-containing protein [Paludibacteraceae bacterium]|nr:DUF2442 domain-containing protein [Paludibacteraceae bacterium]
MLRVTDVEYIKDYQLLLTFNDGISKLVDLENYLSGEVFGPLRDKNLFIQFALTRMTIEWVNGADLAPEFLYDIGKIVERNLYVAEDAAEYKINPSAKTSYEKSL